MHCANCKVTTVLPARQQHHRFGNMMRYLIYIAMMTMVDEIYNNAH